jgi:hypothetical protein
LGKRVEELWGVLTMGENGRRGEGVRPVAVMDGGGAKSSLGQHFDARRSMLEGKTECGRVWLPFIDPGKRWRGGEMVGQAVVVHYQQEADYERGGDGTVMI